MARKTQPIPRSFEEAIAELERILADIEGGEVPLEQSLTKYERGNFLIQHCRGILNQAEKQVELMTPNADGSVSTGPLDETEEPA